MEISLGFTLVGEDMEGTRTDLTDAKPATVIPIDQDTYYEAEAPFERGERAGWVHGTAVLTYRNQLVCQLTFSFESDPEDSIVAHGVLPRDDGGIGAGHLAVTGGTGRFEKASGALKVETRNPKRYSF